MVIPTVVSRARTGWNCIFTGLYTACEAAQGRDTASSVWMYSCGQAEQAVRRIEGSRVLSKRGAVWYARQRIEDRLEWPRW